MIETLFVSLTVFAILIPLFKLYLNVKVFKFSWAWTKPELISDYYAVASISAVLWVAYFYAYI